MGAVQSGEVLKDVLSHLDLLLVTANGKVSSLRCDCSIVISLLKSLLTKLQHHSMNLFSYKNFV